MRVALEGHTLAESSSPVLLFEPGLPTRYYFNRTDVDFTRLVPTSTVTACPCKGRTSGYWSVRVNDILHQDLAWTYDFPTAALDPIRAWSASTTRRSTSSSTAPRSRGRTRTSPDTSVRFGLQLRRRLARRHGGWDVWIRSVLVSVRLLARKPGMSGMMGSAPVLIRIVSAVTVRLSPPAVTPTVCGSVNAAWPVTIVTVSRCSRSRNCRCGTLR
ncbi:DUF427 domain-containing protein [Acrocarpospora sp. B8E8]|uniref:DUF427 domain-containing protein n=1 Tax=Acrocarpospora sp. B8E8 TaxID=3153572 RepID=UPI00325D54AF